MTLVDISYTTSYSIHIRQFDTDSGQIVMQHRPEHKHDNDKMTL